MPLFPEALARSVAACHPMALAFSGGLDSRFLAHAAQVLAQTLAPAPESLCLVHVHGPHVPQGESRKALAWAQARGLRCVTVFFDPLAFDAVRHNHTERCYHCKKAMFLAIGHALAALPQGAGHFVLCDGSNASDSQSYRPGLAALSELGVRSPLAEAALSKQDIRLLAAQSGLERPEQTPRPCLLTRFAYGLEADAPTLAALEKAEDAVAQVLAKFFAPGQTLQPTQPTALHNPHKTKAVEAAPAVPDFRLRFLVPQGRAGGQDRQAELHLSASLFPALTHALAAALAKHGFADAAIREMPQISGLHDRTR